MRVLREAYDLLLGEYGAQGWWPTVSRRRDARRFEVVLGAVLVQRTSWRNVKHAINKLAKRRLINPRRLHALNDEELEQAIHPAGPIRVKARRLRNVLRLIVEEFGSLDALFELPTDELRATLLGVNGIGPETADAILLYAADRPRFVVDAYLRRVVERHGWVDGDLSYDGLQRQFEGALPADVGMFNEYHALIVEVGKRHCGPKPRCEGCPLRPMLSRKAGPRA